MTKDDIIQAIRDARGYNTGLDEGIILRTMNRVQEKYEQGGDMLPCPWFCFDPEATVTLNVPAAGVMASVALPDGHIAFDEDWLLTYLDSDSVPRTLKRRPMSVLQSDPTMEGAPTLFDEMNGVLYFYPRPTQAYTINVPHYAATEALSTAETSPWFENFANLLIEETAFLLSKNSRDKGFVQMSDINTLRQNYIIRCEAKRHSMRQYHLGGNA